MIDFGIAIADAVDGTACLYNKKLKQIGDVMK